jgi:hypothetical protein
MSCNICHTPILVHSNFLDPRDPGSITQDDHLEPIFSKVCPPASHQQYFKNVVQLDRRLEGVNLNELVHAGRGVFMSTQFRICGGCANIVKQEEVSPEGITGGCVRIPLFQVLFSTMLHMRDASSCFATDLVFLLIFLHLGGRL